MAKKNLPKILIVCSSGGHLLQFYQLRGWWSKYERVWVTFDKQDSQCLLEGEKMYPAYFPTTRNIPNFLKNILLSIRVLLVERPDIVVSTGAGVAVPFFYLAKLIRAKTIFIEAFNRVSSPTLTGRLVYPVSDIFFVQWESQRKNYKKSRLLGRLL